MSAVSVGGQGASESSLTLTDGDMPKLFRVADKAAMRMQAAFFRWLRAELVLLTLAAAVVVFSAFGQPALMAPSFTIAGFTIPPLGIVELVSALFIALALGIRIYRYIKHFETEWYEARAAAESAKSVAWRYAVGGRPFPLGGDEAAMNTLLLRRLDETLTDVAHELSQSNFTPDEQITPGMKRLRAASLPDREAAYRKGRIQDQVTWYGDKSEWNRQRGLLWHWVMIIVEVLGAAGSVALAIHWLPFSPQGVVAAVVGAIISWTQSKRYQDLYASYRVTASELGEIEQGIANQTTDQDWSTFVDEAEEACSREHHLWRATRDE